MLLAHDKHKEGFFVCRQAQLSHVACCLVWLLTDHLVEMQRNMYLLPQTQTPSTPGSRSLPGSNGLLHWLGWKPRGGRMLQRHHVHRMQWLSLFIMLEVLA